MATRPVGRELQRYEMALRAVERFKRMQPALGTFVTALAGRRMSVVLKPGGAYTDGRDIFLSPPISMGAQFEHELKFCDVRDELTKQIICKACRANEIMFQELYHEISHIVGNSFKKPDTPTQVYASDFRTKRFSRPVTLADCSDFNNLANAVHKMALATYRVFDDVRVNEILFSRRSGTRVMFEANDTLLFREGYQDITSGSFVYPTESTFFAHVLFAAYAFAHQFYDILNYLDSRAVAAFDVDMINHCAKTSVHTNTVDEQFINALDFFGMCIDRGLVNIDKAEPSAPSAPPAPPETPEDGEKEETDNEPESGPESEDGPESNEDAGRGSSGSDDGDSMDDEGDTGTEGSDEADLDGDDDSESGDDDSDSSGLEDDGRPVDDGEGGDEGRDDLDSDSSGGSGDNDEQRDDAGVPGASGDGELTETPEPGDLHDEGSDDSSGDLERVPDSSEGSVDPELHDEVERDGTGSAGSPGAPDGSDGDGSAESEGSSVDRTDADTDGSLPQGPGNNGLDVDATDEELQSIINSIVEAICGTKSADRKGGSGVVDDKLIEMVINQMEHFDEGSWTMGSVVHESGDKMQCLDPYTKVELPASTSAIVSKSLTKARAVFADNERIRRVGGLKRGDIDPKMLGARAPLGDPRIMARKRRAGRKDYGVAIGIDISGSTNHGAREIELESADALCTLLNSLRIKFSVYTHTGVSSSSLHSKYDLYMGEIKGPYEPWTADVRRKLQRVRSMYANLDGHALEFLRKRVQEMRATDKIVVYYSDGAMPAENREDELHVLLREVQTCKRLGIYLAGIGIDCDDPKKYGMDTVRINTAADIPKVLEHLERILEG